MVDYPDPAVPGELYRFDARWYAAESGLDPDLTTWWAISTATAPSWGTVKRPSDGYFNNSLFEGIPPQGTTENTITMSTGNLGSPVYEIAGLELATPVTPTRPTLNTATGILTIPSMEGVSYWGNTLDPLPAGPLQLDDGIELAVHAEADPGYVLEGTTAWTFTWTDPDAPDPGAYGEWVTSTAERVARMMGGANTAKRTAAAEDAVSLIGAYVHGYTGGWEGRGWDQNGVPNERITAVVTVAAIRLASNPRQVTMFTTSDYSERPAVMAGWTLAERAVLRRYRRVTA